jgi:hypothetical protein
MPARLKHADTGARDVAVWRGEVDGEELADAPHRSVALDTLIPELIRTAIR